MFREITSASNPFFKQLRTLASSKKARQDSNSFIIEGWRGIETLLKHKSPWYELVTLVVSPEWVNDSRLPSSVDTLLIPEHLFAKISDVRNAQGILGVVTHSHRPFIVPESGNLLLLDTLRDPGNLGTLIRSAVGAAFDGILLYGDCVDPFNPKVVRSTMGTFAFCNLWHIGDGEIEQLQAAGYDFCITVGMGGENLYAMQFGPKTVLVVGSEAHGVSQCILKISTRMTTIPMAKECESLNAAIAGSICMFQIACGARYQ